MWRRVVTPFDSLLWIIIRAIYWPLLAILGARFCKKQLSKNAHIGAKQILVCSNHEYLSVYMKIVMTFLGLLWRTGNVLNKLKGVCHLITAAQMSVRQSFGHIDTSWKLPKGKISIEQKCNNCCNALLLEKQISIIRKSILHHSDTFFCRSVSLKITARRLSLASSFSHRGH